MVELAYGLELCQFSQTRDFVSECPFRYLELFGTYLRLNDKIHAGELPVVKKTQNAKLILCTVVKEVKGTKTF